MIDLETTRYVIGQLATEGASGLGTLDADAFAFVYIIREHMNLGGTFHDGLDLAQEWASREGDE